MMGRWLRSMVPFAVALAAFGIAVSWLLGQNKTLGLWLLAGFLVAHGLIHLLFVVPAPAPKSAAAPEWPFNMAGSWLVARAGLSATTVRMVGIVLVVIVVACFALAGLATAGVVLPTDGWRIWTAGSAAASLLLLALFAKPDLILGAGIDAVFLWVAVARVWAP